MSTGGGGGGDARSVLLAKRKRQMMAGGDARDRLGQMAKTTDARAKITKIRNIKQGKLDVKKTSKGGITITTTTRGNMVLTTRKKGAVAAAASVRPRAFVSATAAAALSRPVAAAAQRRQIGNVTRRVGRGGQISLTTRVAGSALRPTAAAHMMGRQVPAARRAAHAAPLSSSRHFLDREEDEEEHFRPRGETFRPREETFKPLVRTIRGTMSRAAQLDEELLNTHVEPVVLKRTIRQQVRERERSPEGPPPRTYKEYHRVPRSPERYVPPGARGARGSRDRMERSRSPMDMDDGRGVVRRSSRPAYRDYDRPTSREDDVYRRRLMEEKMDEEPSRHSSRTIADRLDADLSSQSASPLAGSKVVVSNLQESVTQEDIVELFGDIGALKRARLVEPGVAEVVFVKMSDAAKAVEIYHNRQLDGKPMKCRVYGAAAAGPKYGKY